MFSWWGSTIQTLLIKWNTLASGRVLITFNHCLSVKLMFPSKSYPFNNLWNVPSVNLTPLPCLSTHYTILISLTCWDVQLNFKWTRICVCGYLCCDSAWSDSCTLTDFTWLRITPGKSVHTSVAFSGWSMYLGIRVSC